MAAGKILLIMLSTRFRPTFCSAIHMRVTSCCPRRIFFRRIEIWLRRYESFERLLDWLFARTRRKAGEKIQKYETIGLILFVGVPLPVTGAWTGSLIAYVFDLDIKRSFYAIFAGVVIAGIAILVLSVLLDYNL